MENATTWSDTSWNTNTSLEAKDGSWGFTFSAAGAKADNVGVSVGAKDGSGGFTFSAAGAKAEM